MYEAYLPKESQITFPCLSKIIVRTPWCVKSIDNQVTGKSAQKLNRTDSNNTLSVKILKRILDLFCRLGIGEVLGEHIRVLDSLASSSVRANAKRENIVLATKEIRDLNIRNTSFQNKETRYIGLTDNTTYCPKFGIIAWIASPMRTTLPSAQLRKNSGALS